MQITFTSSPGKVNICVAGEHTFASKNFYCHYLNKKSYNEMIKRITWFLDGLQCCAVATSDNEACERIKEIAEHL